MHLGELPRRVRPLGRVGFADAAMIVNDHLIAIDQGRHLFSFHGAPGQPVPETNKTAAAAEDS